MRLTVRLVCVLAVLLVATAPARAKDSDRPIVNGPLGEKLEVAVRKAGGPDLWGAVLVARDGEILLARGYGFADFDKTPNTPRTLFEIASASKQVAATAILHLEQRKKLRVTDTLSRFFKKVPPDKKDIQLHHLLTHTSGISGNVGVPYASTLPRKRYVERMMATQLIAKPGEKYQYCNVGYALLAAVVEEVTGSSFEKYVEKRLFRKAKCADTGFITDRDLIKSGRDSTRRSTQPGTWTAANWHWGWGYKGMGGVVTTVLDVLRWDRALRGDDLLGEKARAKLYTPFKSGYAYGWNVAVTDRGTRRVSHSGGVAGYGANIVRFLEDDVVIVVLSNKGQSAHAVTQAVEALLFEPVPIEVTIDTKGYEPNENGKITLPKTLKWQVRKRGKTFVLQARDRSRTPFEIRMPKGCAIKLKASLEAAISAREADDAGGEAELEGALFLQRYLLSRRIEIKEKASVEIRPEYRTRNPDGTPFVDPRALLVVVDPVRGAWPVMVHMNVAAAKALLEAIVKVVK